MKDKVEVFNGVNGQAVIDVPQLNLRREWPRKGAKVLIKTDDLLEAIYDPGVEYMFKHGILYTKDPEVNRELGLVDDDTNEPTVTILDDAKMQRYLVNVPLPEFKNFVKTLSREQVRVMADYAIEHEISVFDKSEIIKDICGTDIIKSIELNRADKEG